MHHQQFNIQQLDGLPTLYLFCIYLRTNSDLCHLQYKLIGFYTRDEMCLQRGTDWVFKSRIAELRPTNQLLAQQLSHLTTRKAHV
jgi:hypothetical protein